MSKAGAEKLFSIVLVAYGDYSYCTRALRSLADTPNLTKICDVHVGCNACGPKTLACVRHYSDTGLITSAVESACNLHKDPMVRLLRDLVKTPYVLYMDDDSYVKPLWAEALLDFINREDPLDLAGAMHVFRRSDEYQKLARQRPWWRGDLYIPDEQRHLIRLCVGGLYLARTDFLRRHDYPDRDMRIEFGDVLLADLVYQVGGRMVEMPDELLAHFVISDGDRRWVHNKAPSQSDTRPAAHLAPRHISPAEALRIGQKLFQAKRYEESEAACRKMLQAEPQNPIALHLLGLVTHQTGRNSLAVELLRHAIALKPDVPDFHNNLGNVLAKLGRLEEAIDCFQKATTIRPEYAEAHNNLANVLARQGRSDAAIAGYRKAAQLKPGYVEAYTNLGATLGKLGRFDEVVECFRRAVQIDPNSAEAYSSLAMAYQNQNDLEEALKAIDQAIARKEDDPRLRFNRALMLLMAGNWVRGWQEYEWRWRLSEHHSERLRFKQPLWEGEALGGRTLLLHCEQGLGSTLQFIRFAPLIAQNRGKVVVECQPPLKNLLSCLSPHVEILARGEALPKFDIHLPLMSAPRVLKITPTSIPNNLPYLTPDSSLVVQWRQRLASEHAPKVGIAWQGNPAYAGDAARSIPLRFFQPLGKIQGIRLYSLQKIRGLDQIAQLDGKLPLVDFGSELDDSAGPFIDTAAVIANLDLVITCDTSVAHLAGALGAKVWVALCFAPDWRWMIAREDCPWYPQMRLFRQKKPGDWDDVFNRIAGELAVEAGKEQ